MVTSADSLNSLSVTTLGDTEHSDRVRDNRKPHYPNQDEVNDLIRDLDLPKWRAELLLSRMNQ